MLSLDRVSKVYGSTLAVDDLSLDVEAGSMTVLIGPSGCGKSTVLRLMAGLVRPDQGVIRFDRRPVVDDWSAVRHRMGYVIQDGGLFPHLTGRENLSLQSKMLDRSKTDITDRVEQLRQMVRLKPDLLDRYPSEMSGGQRQRVALMRALMTDPSVLLLDEPLGALDPIVRFDLQEQLAEIFRSLNKSVVMVTHDLAEAVFFAGNIIVMNEGRIVQRGLADEITRRPQNDFVRNFVRSYRPPLGVA